MPYFQDKYANSTACQVQGNMCTMLRYGEDVPNACTMHKEGIDDDDWYDCVVSCKILFRIVYISTIIFCVAKNNFFPQVVF